MEMDSFFLYKFINSYLFMWWQMYSTFALKIKEQDKMKTRINLVNDLVKRKV